MMKLLDENGKCKRCRGSGWIIEINKSINADGEEEFDDVHAECPDCGGEGKCLKLCLQLKEVL